MAAYSFKHLRYILVVFLLLGCVPTTQESRPVQQNFSASASELAELGRTLFFDANLSLQRTQSCASCHDPEYAFIDPRNNATGSAVSLGADGVSLGDRNAPTAAYAFLTPVFGKDGQGEYRGGLFHDGRAATLAVQAGQPLLNPLEMALPDLAMLVDRVRENPHYVDQFKRLFGDAVFASPKQLHQVVGQAIAAFERTPAFASFDSKYDRYLRGEYRLTPLEDRGRMLFFSPMTNCSSCHVLHTFSADDREPFTNYRYHNIGIPANHRARAQNGVAKEHRDTGLMQNPAVQSAAQAGKFKVPSLRNIAVTGPYMHNGVFQELETAIAFYNKYQVSGAVAQTNPETGNPWMAPEVKENIASELLRQGQPLTPGHIEAIVAFLRTLTDKKYEHLLQP